MKKYKYRHREVYKGIDIDVRADTRKELFIKVDKKKKSIDGNIIDGSICLKNYAIKWAETYKKYTVSLSWYNDILRIIDKFIGFVGNKPLNKIKEIEVQQFINSTSIYSDSYVKKIYDIVNQIFKRAYKDRLIQYEFHIERIKGKPNGSGRRITNKERQFLLQALSGHRGELFCKFMLYCGLRGGEVSALQWKDVDLNKGIVKITKALKKDGVIGYPKSSSSIRNVPIPSNFINELLKRSREPFSYIVTMSNGKPYTQTARKKMWNSVKREMNILMGCKVFRNALVPPFPLDEEFKLHYLRHTYCTDLELMGVPINIAKTLMGHSSIEVTAKIYTHTTDETLEKARVLIDTGNLMGNNAVND